MNETKTTDNVASPRESGGLLIDSLASMPARAILDESELAKALEVTPRTIRRMVGRFELPPPTKLGGRSVWMVGKVLQHLEDALDRAAEAAAKEQRRIERLTP